MKIIDNRYKIDYIYEEKIESTVYVVTDLWGGEKNFFLKLFNFDRRYEIIDYFMDNFVFLSNIKHGSILSSETFNIIKTIDRRNVKINQYYYTIEYTDNLTLDKCIQKLGLNQKLNIIYQLLTVIDFLHFKGIIYKHLSPDNIFVDEDGNIKLRAITSIFEKIFNNDYNDNFRMFIVPEVILKQSNVDINADFYSFGMIIKYLFQKNIYDDFKVDLRSHNEHKLIETQIDCLYSIVNMFTKKNAANRDGKVKDIIESLNRAFYLEYKRDLKKERELLNFKTPMVGRKNEVSNIVHIDEEFDNKIYNTRMVLVDGESGVGKTRFLKELSYVLKYKGRNVYYIEESGKNHLGSLTDVLRKMVKASSNNLLNKYGSELVKIIPELRFLKGISPSPKLSKEKEKLRLYDRTASFIEEFIQENPTYIIIDNFHNSDKDTLDFINYALKNMKKCPLLIIASYNPYKLYSSEDDKAISEWNEFECVKKMKITRLDLDEIGEMVKHILGISYKPLKFSVVLLKETLGNPRYIEYVLKDLYAMGELYISDDGFWNLKAKNYSEIYMPTNIDEALTKQLDFLTEEQFEIEKTLSIFNSPVSKGIIIEMTGMNKDKLNDIIEELVSMKLIDERVEDWGFSYTFYNMQLKKYIYYNIDKDERKDFHKKAAKILERLHELEKRENIDELVYHLVLSGQKEKAVEYLILHAKKMEYILNAEAISLWEKAYELLDEGPSKKKLEILISLGNLLIAEGENDNALNVFNQVLNDANILNSNKYIAIAKNAIGEIYIRRSQHEKAEKFILEAQKSAKNIGYLDGQLNSIYSLNKIYIDRMNLDKAFENTQEAIKIANENNREEYCGLLYNQIGLIYYYEGNMDEAIECFEKSISYCQNIGNFVGSAKPINNLANIYSGYYGDKNKAMEYYTNGLDICEKYNLLEEEMILLNNIGEIHMENHDYEKAKENIEKSKKIANDIEDYRIIFTTTMNLGQIYLVTGDFDSCFNCYYLAKEGFEKRSIQNKEITCQYYNFLGEFYFKFGKYDEALEHSLKAVKYCTDFDLEWLLDAKSRVVLIKYLKDGILDKDEIEDIREKYRNRNSFYDRRKKLLLFAMLAMEEKDYEYLYDLLEEDEQLKEYDNKNIEFVREFIELYLKNDDASINRMLELEEKIKNEGYIGIDLFANKGIADKYFIKKEYYRAANYYVEALDIIYRLTKKIQEKDFQISYVKTHGGDYIKKRLEKIFNTLVNQEVDFMYLEDFTKDNDLDDYFDFKYIFEFMNDEKFYDFVNNYYSNNTLGEIDSIEKLMYMFTDDYITNLDYILKYLVKETFAQKGIICIYDEDMKLYPLVSVGNVSIDDINKDVIKLVKQRDKGIVIKNIFKDNKNNLLADLLSGDSRALICVPIFKVESQLDKMKERRMSYDIERTIGYIYLETDRLFNRFDYEHYNLVKSLSYLAFLNVENYNLKLLSSVDKMTTAYTRKYFDVIFKSTVEESMKNNETFSVLMIDIDKFKNVNDTFGHQKGDEVLGSIGRILVSNVRSSDIVARYGGEEFIIVLKSTTEKEAKEVAEKLRKVIEKSDLVGNGYILTISIGISVFPKHSQFKDELIEKADQALYYAKESGRNRVALWSNNIAGNVNRMDRLAGIISGNTVQDQRNTLAILDAIDLIKKDISIEEKIYNLLGILIATIDSEFGMIFRLDDREKINNIYCRKRFKTNWIEVPNYNKSILYRTIKNKKGEFLIDWENINEIDVLSDTPNWESIIVVPLINKGVIKGVLQVSVPIREKEFDYDDFNLVNTIGNILATYF